MSFNPLDMYLKNLGEEPLKQSKRQYNKFLVTAYPRDVPNDQKRNKERPCARVPRLSALGTTGETGLPRAEKLQGGSCLDFRRIS